MTEQPVVDDTALLISAITDLAVVRGKVTLASGKEADYYVDLRRVTLDGKTAPIIGRVMRDLVADWDFEAVGGLTLGADPVAVAMLHSAASVGEELDPSSYASKARPMVCNGRSRDRRSLVARCSPSRTPRPPEVRC